MVLFVFFRLRFVWLNPFWLRLGCAMGLQSTVIKVYDDETRETEVVLQNESPPLGPYS
jgi:hypothetical protein